MNVDLDAKLKDNAIFMEQDEYEEYLRQKKQELQDQFEKIRVENPEKIMDTTMYDLNHDLIAQLKDLTPTEIKKRMKLIRSWLYHDTDIYYALVCHEWHYITIFRFPNDNYDDQIKEIQEIITSLGPIKAIDPTGLGKAVEMHHIEDKIDQIDAFEIWIKIDDDMKMFMLFPYGGGIVEV